MAKQSKQSEDNENPLTEQFKEKDEKPKFSAQDVSEMMEWFHYFDKNGDKKLDNNEMSKVFAALGWNLTDAEQEELFKIHDTDKSGFIEEKEYERLLRSLQKDKNTEKLELLEAFRKFDTNRDGTMGKKELQRFMLSRDMAFTSKDTNALTALMEKADKDKSGDVDIEEFVTLLLEVPNLELLKAQQMNIK